ncbi:MAG: VOC family protein [Patescibacteria group bacterium]
MDNIEDILGDYTKFLDNIFGNLDRFQINVSNYYMDHICYRVSTFSLYEEKKISLSEIAELLLENEVGGRLISKFKLFHPLIYRDREISIIELPSPKEGTSYEDGLEHVEFVINMSLVDFRSLYSNIDFNLEGQSKNFNADVAVTFGKYTAKFHEQSLEEVVRIEKQKLL